MTLEAEIADKLAEFFKDPIDKECSYCEEAKAVIPIIAEEIKKGLEEGYEGCEFIVWHRIAWQAHFEQYREVK